MWSFFQTETSPMYMHTKYAWHPTAALAASKAPFCILARLLMTVVAQTRCKRLIGFPNQIGWPTCKWEVLMSNGVQICLLLCLRYNPRVVWIMGVRPRRVGEPPHRKPPPSSHWNWHSIIDEFVWETPSIGIITSAIKNYPHHSSN